MLGDQVYADDLSPAMREFTESRTEPRRRSATTQLDDFEEYALAYREAWGDAADPLAPLDGARWR